MIGCSDYQKSRGVKGREGEGEILPKLTASVWRAWLVALAVVPTGMGVNAPGTGTAAREVNHLSLTI